MAGQLGLQDLIAQGPRETGTRRRAMGGGIRPRRELVRYNNGTMIWWILGGIAAFVLLIVLWLAGSVLYLKLRFRHLSESDWSRLSDLEKEERRPQSGSS